MNTKPASCPCPEWRRPPQIVRMLRILALVSIIHGSLGIATGVDSPVRPHVLFLSVDDLKPALGCYGDTAAITPNIDRLAETGTTFLRNYCQAAHCNPSRASLMTGLRPDSAGVSTADDPYFRDFVPDAKTLPQYFSENGYRTVKAGKIFHNEQDPQSWEVILNEWKQPGVSLYNAPESKAKFKEALKTIERLQADGKSLKPWERSRMMLSTSSEAVDVPDNAYPDGAITDLALEALRTMKATGEPTFLAVGWYKPHLPFNCPEKYWKMYDSIESARNPFAPKDAPPLATHEWEELRAYSDIPPQGPLTEQQAARLLHGYYACVSFADAQIGRVLKELDNLGLTANTIVVLWGDHGFHLGDHGLWCKHTVFESATRSPLIIRAPGLPENQKVEALTEFVDVYPTLCDLANLPIPDGLEGTSLKPLMLDPGHRPWKAVALSQYPRGSFIGRSQRTDRYRFTVWEQKGSRQVKAIELYDHWSDPGEDTNVAHAPENAQIVADFMKQHETLWK